MILKLTLDGRDPETDEPLGYLRLIAVNRRGWGERADLDPQRFNEKRAHAAAKVLGVTLVIEEPR